MTIAADRDSVGRRMLRAAACLLTLCLVWSAAPAQSSPESSRDGEALASAKRCNACHTIDETLLGPPYRAVAARHADERALEIEVLAHKIVHGGAGNWGVVPMVPNEHVSLDEARTIAAWILSLNDREAAQ